MKGSYLWFIAIILGGIIMAASCFDKGTMDLDDTRMTQPVCSDLPQNDPRVLAGDCRTSREVLDADHSDTNWLWFVVGAAVLVTGLAGAGGYLPFGKRTVVTETKTPPASRFGAMLLLAQIPAPDDRMMWLEHPYLLGGFVILLLGGIGLVVYKRRQYRRQRGSS